MPELELIGASPSNYVWTCRIALAEKGVAYRHSEVMPHTAEVDAIHPFGKIPVMRHGAVEIFESRAICGYIDSVFPGAKLMPADPVVAAQVEQWISLVNTHIDPVWVRQYLRGYVFPGTPDGSPDRALIDAAVPKMEAQFAVMDRAVGKTGHLVGDAFTLADMNPTADIRAARHRAAPGRRACTRPRGDATRGLAASRRPQGGGPGQGPGRGNAPHL